MEILNIVLDHKIIFSCLIGILIINFGCILFLVLRERKADEEEIEDLMNELNEEPKKKIERVQPKKIEEEKLEKVQDEKLEKNKSEVEAMLMKMQKDLEAKPEDVVNNFENEQEEQSIISYQELVNSVKEKKSNVEVNVQPVKIEIEEEPKEKVVEKIKKTLFDDEDTLELEPITEKKFKTTDFISPIFGKQDAKIEYPIVKKKEDVKRSNSDNFLDELDFDVRGKHTKEEIEENKMINLTPIREEIKKNDEFLKALKDFRKNLD